MIKKTIVFSIMFWGAYFFGMRLIPFMYYTIP